MTLSVDIKKRIDKLFPLQAQRQEVEHLLLSLWTISLNVGEEQLARSILFLSEGQISEVQKIFNSNFLGDPRDVVMIAHTKSGNAANYFLDPFPDEDIKEPPREL